jgi:glycosyltransferase involved in cell wall biosynthesis
MPKFSVVVPCYRIAGRRHLVEQCLASIARQTCTDFELLLVDDGSPDDTRAVLADLLEKYPTLRERGRIIPLAQNGGVCAARNAGIESATGQYVAFLDYDDLWQAEYLEIVRQAVDELATVRVVLVRTDFMTQLGDRLRVRSQGPITHLNAMDFPDFAAWHMLHNFPVGLGSASVVTRNLYVERPDLRYDLALTRTTAEDVLFGFQLLDQGIRPRYVDEPLCVARRIVGHVSRGMAAHLFLDEKQVNDYISEKAANSLTAKILAARPEYRDALDQQRRRLDTLFSLKREYLRPASWFGIRTCVAYPRACRSLVRLHLTRWMQSGPLRKLLDEFEFRRSGNDPRAYARVDGLLAAIGVDRSAHWS